MKKANIESLVIPREISFHIMSYLDDLSFYMSVNVCKDWNKLGKEYVQSLLEKKKPPSAQLLLLLTTKPSTVNEINWQTERKNVLSLLFSKEKEALTKLKDSVRAKLDVITKLDIELGCKDLEAFKIKLQHHQYLCNFLHDALKRRSFYLFVFMSLSILSLTLVNCIVMPNLMTTQSRETEAVDASPAVLYGNTYRRTCTALTSAEVTQDDIDQCKSHLANANTAQNWFNGLGLTDIFAAAIYLVHCCMTTCQPCGTYHDTLMSDLSPSEVQEWQQLTEKYRDLVGNIKLTTIKDVVDFIDGIKDHIITEGKNLLNDLKNSTSKKTPYFQTMQDNSRLSARANRFFALCTQSQSTLKQEMTIIDIEEDTKNSSTARLLG